MANRDAPKGFKPVRHLTGGEIRPELVRVNSSNTIIGTGDPLIQVDDGTVNRSSGGTDVIYGVAAQPVAASTGGTMLAYLDPNIVFVAQTDDGTGTATAETCLNLNIQHVNGTASNGVSIAELDENTANTNADYPWKIVGLHKAIDNAFGEFNKLEVVANNHKMKGGTGTLGV